MLFILLLLTIMFGFKAVFKGIVKLTFGTLISIFVVIFIIAAALGGMA